MKAVPELSHSFFRYNLILSARCLSSCTPSLIRYKYASNSQPQRKVVTKLDVFCFDLAKTDSIQESLFETSRERKRNVSTALDNINNKWGERTIYFALTHGREKEVIDRIAFGGVKDLEEVYAM